MASRSVIIIEAQDLATQKLSSVERQMGRMGGVLVGMSQEIGHLNLRNQQNNEELDQTPPKLNLFSQAVGGLVKNLVSLGSAYASIKGLRIVHDLALQGAQAEMTEASFSRMLASVGASPEVLNRMKAAAGGTIPEMKLMQALNTSLIGVSDEFGNAMARAYPQLIQMARAANIANPALGTTDFMLQSLAIGLKRNSIKIIDNLGIQVKLTEANQRAAEMYGKSTKALTEEEKAMGLLNLTLERGMRLVDQVGLSNDNAVVKQQVLTTAVADTKIELGKSITAILSYQGVLAGAVTILGEYASRSNEARDAGVLFQTALNEAAGSGEGLHLQARILELRLRNLQNSFKNGYITANEFNTQLVEMATAAGIDTEAIRRLDPAVQRLLQGLGSIEFKGFTGGAELAEGAFDTIGAATDAFNAKLAALLENEQVTGDQALRLSAIVQTLADSFEPGTVNTAKLVERIAELTGTLPDLQDNAVEAAKDILKTDSAMSAAAKGFSSAAPGFDDIQRGYRGIAAEAKAAAEEAEKATAKIVDPITSQAGKIAAEYADIVPMRTLQARYARVEEWAKQNAERLAGMSEWQRDVEVQTFLDGLFAKEQGLRDSLERQTQLQEEAARVREQANQKMLSDIQGLMKPTVDESIWKDALPREDTWDEWARRAATVAAEGWGSEWLDDMQALDPDFQALLEEMGDPKAAAAVWIDQFYKGMHPEAVDVDKVAQDYIDMIKASERWAEIANVVADKVRAAGYDPSEEAIAALAQGDKITAMDLIEENFEDNIKTTGTSAGTALSETFGEEVTTPSYISDMLTALNEQFDEQQDEWDALGLRMGETLSTGVLKALTSSGFMAGLVSRLAPEILRYIGETGWGRCVVQQQQAGGRPGL